jgi:hypothetical protein
MPKGGFSDMERVWLYTQLEGLIYRSVTYMTVDDARRVYADHGVGLGVPD